MTMPQLMNCRDSDDGWGLECVKELWEACERFEMERDRAVAEVARKERVLKHRAERSITLATELASLKAKGHS